MAQESARSTKKWYEGTDKSRRWLSAGFEHLLYMILPLLELHLKISWLYLLQMCSHKLLSAVPAVFAEVLEWPWFSSIWISIELKVLTYHLRLPNKPASISIKMKKCMFPPVIQASPTNTRNKSANAQSTMRRNVGCREEPGVRTDVNENVSGAGDAIAGSCGGRSRVRLDYGSVALASFPTSPTTDPCIWAAQTLTMPSFSFFPGSKDELPHFQSLLVMNFGRLPLAPIHLCCSYAAAYPARKVVLLAPSRDAMIKKLTDCNDTWIKESSDRGRQKGLARNVSVLFVRFWTRAETSSYTSFSYPPSCKHLMLLLSLLRKPLSADDRDLEMKTTLSSEPSLIVLYNISSFFESEQTKDVSECSNYMKSTRILTRDIVLQSHRTWLSLLMLWTVVHTCLLKWQMTLVLLRVIHQTRSHWRCSTMDSTPYMHLINCPRMQR